MSIAAVAMSSLWALLPKRRRAAVQWRAAFVFAAAGLPAACGGAALGDLVPQRRLLMAFAANIAPAALGCTRAPATLP